MLKQCTKCGETKAIKLFYKGKAYKDGYRSECKVCLKEYHKKHNQNPHVRVYKAKHAMNWRSKNMDKYLTMHKHHVNKSGSGVYYILTDGGDYIGESKTIQARIYSHSVSTLQNNSLIAGNYKIISWKILEEVVPNKELLREREAYWIKKLNPSLNVQLST